MVYQQNDTRDYTYRQGMNRNLGVRARTKIAKAEIESIKKQQDFLHVFYGVH